jgi:hypothetical protein
MDSSVRKTLNKLKSEFVQLQADEGLRAKKSMPELEIRAGTLEPNRFNSSVSRFLFNSVIDMLTVITKSDVVEFSHTRDYTYHFTPRPNDKRRINPNHFRIRRTLKDDGQTYWISKFQLPEWKVDIPEHNLRVSLSVESPMEPRDDLSPTGQRDKHRITFNFATMRVECTHVQYRHFDREGMRDSFEIEMEYNNVSQFDNDLMWFIRLLQGMSRFPIQTHHYTEIKDQFERVFDKGSWSKNLYPKPRDLNREDIPHLDKYVVTDKTDGVRRWLFITGFGLVMMNAERHHAVIKRITPVHYTKGVGTLLEGEYIPERNEFLIFDILSVDGNDIRQKNFKERKQIINSLHKKLLINSVHKRDLVISVKEFKKGQDIDGALNRLKTLPYDNDGLIFTPRHEGYNPHRLDILKWKPPDQLTIDFELKRVEGGFNLHVQDTNDRTAHFKDAFYKAELHETINGIPLRDGSIVEFKYQNGRWRPLRIRHDKTRGNFVTVAIDVWKHIENPISEDELRGSSPLPLKKVDHTDRIETDNRVKGMRGFHNAVKRRLIESMDRDSVVMDIGTGKGGDIHKYKARNITVYAVEPNRDNIAEMKERLQKVDYENMFHIMNVGGEDTDILLDDDMGIKCKGLNTIASFFSLSFFFRDEHMLNGLINTISRTRDKCRPPFKFIGTTIDGQAMYDFLKGYPGVKSAKFRIEKHYKDDDQIGLGKKIVFHISHSKTATEQVEYLVDFQLLTQKLESIGFRLESTQLFEPPSYLCEEERQLSSKYREFSFVSEGSKPQRSYGAFEMLESDRMRYYTRHGLKTDFNWVRIGTLIQAQHESSIGSGSCLIHSILRSSQPLYKKLPREERIRLAGELRVFLSRNIKLDDYTGIQGGQLAVRQTQSVFIEDAMRPFIRDRKHNPSRMVFTTEDELRNIFRTPHSLVDLPGVLHESLFFLEDDIIDELLSRSLTRAYQNYQDELQDCDTYIGDIVFEYVSRVFDLDIYVVDAIYGDIVSHAGHCRDLYTGRKSIIILIINGNHYESMGLDSESGVQTLFEPDHPAIKYLYEKVCGEEKTHLLASLVPVEGTE